MHAPLPRKIETRERRGALVLRQNVVGKQVEEPIWLDRRRRRLSPIVARYANRRRAFLVSVHRRGDTLMPEDHTVRARRAGPGYSNPTWSEQLIGPDDIVVITYVPRGPGSTGKSVGLLVGTVALMAAAAIFAPPIAGAMMGALSGGLFTTASAGTIALVQGALTIGGGFLLSMASRSKANAAESVERPLYGVSGGGNLARYGDRIPEGFGRFWTQPDLVQRDYLRYVGEDVILYKRMRIGIGKYRILEIRTGAAVIWTEGGGIRPPFDAVPGGGGDVPHNSGEGGTDPGPTAIEIIVPGAASTLVPGKVYSHPSVTSIELPRPSDNPQWSGPWRVSPVGKKARYIQIDYALPNGVHSTEAGVGNAAHWGVRFEIAPCDDDDNPTGPWSALHQNGGVLKTTRGFRFTKDFEVAEGDYVVRAQNTWAFDERVNDVSVWDGLRVHYDDPLVREDSTDLAMRIRSGKGLGITAFSDIWVKASRILPVRVGNAWVEQETDKCVWGYANMLRASHGLNLPDDKVDIDRLEYYAGNLTEYDTFNGVIRGPVPLQEAACTMLGPMRAEPMRIGAKWSLRRDEQLAARKHTFFRRQIHRGSTEIDLDLDVDPGKADWIVEYNPDGDPRRLRRVRKTFGAQSLTPSRMRAFGVATHEHATHIATWLAAVGFHRRELTGFRAGREGRSILRGDPVRVDPWFLAPGSRAGGVLARDGLALTLDTDMIVGPSSYAMLRNRLGLEWGPVKVTAPDPEAPNVIALDAADVEAVEAFFGQTLDQVMLADDQEMTSVLVGPLVDVQNACLVREVQPQGRDVVALRVVNDAPEVWEALGEPIAPGPPIPSAGDEPTPAIAVVPWVHARCVQKGAGLAMDWSVGNARGAVSYVVRLSYNNEATYEPVSEGLSTSGSYPLRHEEGVDVKVAAYAVSTVGVSGPVVYTTFTTFKPAVNPGTTEISGVDLAALSEQVTTLLDSGQQGHELAKALRDSGSPLQSLRQIARQTGLIIDNSYYELVDSIGQTAIRLALQAEKVENILSEVGVEQGAGRWTLRGIDKTQGDLRTAQIQLDAQRALIELSATRVELNDAITAASAGMQPIVTWAWNNSVEGWTVSGGTLTAGAGYIDFHATADNAYMQSPALPAFDPVAYPVVRFTTQRTGGTGWGVALKWGASFENSRAFTLPADPATQHDSAVDLSNETTWTGTISALRVTVANGTTIRFSLGQIGKNPLAALLLANIQGEIDNVQLTIDALSQSISAKAEKTTVDAQGARLQTAEQNISANAAAITQRALATELTTTNQRMTAAEASINALAGTISFTIQQTQGPSPLQLAGQGAINDVLSQEGARAETHELAARARTEWNTRITQTGEAIAQELTKLQVQVDGSKAAIEEEKLVRAGVDFAEATARQQVAADLSTEIQTRIAAVINEASARSAADGAEATARQQVAIDLSTETQARIAAVTTVSNVVGTIDGKLSAAWLLTVNAGGQIAAIRAYADNSTNSLTFVSDNVFYAFPGQAGGDPVNVFALRNVNGVAKVALKGDMLADGDIIARHLSVGTLLTNSAQIAGSLIVTGHAQGAAFTQMTAVTCADASFSLANGASQTIGSFGFTADVGHCLMLCVLNVFSTNQGSSGNQIIGVELYVDDVLRRTSRLIGTPIISANETGNLTGFAYTMNGTATVFHQMDVSPGSHTITLKLRNESGATRSFDTTNGIMSNLESKR